MAGKAQISRIQGHRIARDKIIRSITNMCFDPRGFARENGPCVRSEVGVKLYIRGASVEI
jgi:hypothetical protein